MENVQNQLMNRERQDRFLNLPNILTLFRIALVPVFVLLVFKKKPLETLLVFFLAGITDVLDGFAARVSRQKTKIGTILDPAADKLLLVTAFLILTSPALGRPNSIPCWLTAVVIGRDILIASGALVLFKLRGQKTFLPSLLGKASTVCQVSTVLLVLFFNTLESSPPILIWIFSLTLAATLLSGLHYFLAGLAVLSPGKKG